MNTPSHPAATTGTPTPKKNDWPIFISYRRSDATRKIALELKKELESSTIEGTTGQTFALDVFVDVAEAHQSDFQANLVPHLQHSRALIVLADDGAASRKSDGSVDYLYSELDWWANERKKTPPIILQINEKAGSRLVADPQFSSWRKVSFMDCFWEKWGREGVAGEAERKQLLAWLRESIRNYGLIIHRQEVLRLKRRALIAFVFGIAACCAAAFGWLKWQEATEARDAARAELAQSLLSQGEAEIANNSFRSALHPLLKAADIYAEMGKQPGELERLMNIAVEQNHVVADFRAHQEGVALSEYSPDGASLLTSTLVYGELALWDTESWKPRFRKTLASLCHAALSVDARSVITIQRDRPDVEGRPAATYWNRWNASDGTLLESKTLEGFVVDDVSLREGEPNDTYTVSNADDNSRESDDPLKLEVREVETNQKIAEFTFPTAEQLLGTTFLLKPKLLIFNQETGLGLADLSSGISGARHLYGSENYMDRADGWFNRRSWFASEDGNRIFGMHVETNRLNGHWLIWDTQSGDLLHKGEGRPNFGLDVDGLAYSDDDALITTLVGFGFSVRKVELSVLWKWENLLLHDAWVSLAEGLYAYKMNSQLEVCEIFSDAKVEFPMGTRKSWRINLDPTTRRLISFDNIGRAMVFELPQPEFLPVPAMDSLGISLLDSSDDGSQALIRTADNDIVVWDVNAERIVCLLKGAAGSSNLSFEWLPKVNRLLTRLLASGDLFRAEPYTLQVFDTTNGTKLLELGNSFAWGISPDGGTLLSLTGKTLVLHPIGRTGKEVTLPAPTGMDNKVSGAVGFSTDGSLVAIAAPNGKVNVHDAQTGALRNKFDLGHAEKAVRNDHSFSLVLFHSHDRGLLVASNLGTSFMIDIPTGQVQPKLDFQSVHSPYISFQDGGRILVTGPYSVKFWTFPELESISSFAGNTKRVTVFPKEHRFLSEGNYGETVFGNLKSGTDIHSFESPIAASPDHGLVAVYGDSQIEILDFRTARRIKVASSDFTTQGFFSTTADVLYAISSNGTLRKLQVKKSYAEVLRKARLEVCH